MRVFFRNLQYVAAFILLCLSFVGCAVCVLVIPTVAFEPITFAVRWDSMWLVSELIGGFIVSVLLLTAAITIMGWIEGETTIVIPDDEDLH